MSADLLTEAELGADVLHGVAPNVVAEWRRQHNWPHVRIGRRIYYTPEQVAEITRKHTVAGGSVAPKDGRTTRSAARSRGS